MCLDDNNGMMFNHRRQSRDKAVLEHIAFDCKGSNLYMNEYSYKLFADMDMENVVVEPDFIQQAGKGDYCFVEGPNVFPSKADIEKLIIYRWNRKYPADLYFELSLDKEWKLLESKEFQGTSHEKITKEIYVK